MRCMVSYYNALPSKRGLERFCDKPNVSAVDGDAILWKHATVSVTRAANGTAVVHSGRDIGLVLLQPRRELENKLMGRTDKAYPLDYYDLAIDVVSASSLCELGEATFCIN